MMTFKNQQNTANQGLIKRTTTAIISSQHRMIVTILDMDLQVECENS